jgi:hypothetical protein
MTSPKVKYVVIKKYFNICWGCRLMARQAFPGFQMWSWPEKRMENGGCVMILQI